jgi:hypothetical protein
MTRADYQNVLKTHIQEVTSQRLAILIGYVT